MCGVASSGEHRRSREARDVTFAARTNSPSLDWRCDAGAVCWAGHRTRWRSTTTATDFGWRKRQRHRRHRRRWRLDTPASERTINRVLEPKSAQLHRRRERLSDRRHSVSGGRGAGDWRRVARLVHDERWRAQLEDPTAAWVSAGFVYGRSELSFAEAMAPAPIRSSGRARTGSSTTAGWSSIAKRAVAARSSSLASSTTTTRREPQASRSITSVPRSFIALARYQSSRAARSAERRPRRESRDARNGTTRSENPACAPASNRRQSRWSTSRGWPSTFRAPERRCARSEAATLVFRCRRSPADASTWRTRFSMAPVRSAVESCSAAPSIAHERGVRLGSSAEFPALT